MRQGSRIRVRGKGECDARAGAHSRLQPPRSQGHTKHRGIRRQIPDEHRPRPGVGVGQVHLVLRNACRTRGWRWRAIRRKDLGDNFNTLVVPSYTVFDATVSYDLAYARPEWNGWSAQVNVTNVADRYYVASCFTGSPYCSFGTARTVLGTLKYSMK